MLVIRLSRTGRRNQPKYRLVVAEHSAPIKGKVVEILGHYDPTTLNKEFVFDKEKVESWIKQGAQPSNTVAKILNSHGFALSVHMHPERKSKKEPKVKVEKPATPAQPVASEIVSAEVAQPVEEVVGTLAPAEEAPAEVSEPVAEEPVEVPTVAEEATETEVAPEAPAE